MEVIKKHQTLIELESLISKILAKNTNYAYSQGSKHSFSYTFTKGEQAIEHPETLKSTKDYYVFQFSLVDKSSPVAITKSMYKALYPVQIGISAGKLLEIALQDFIAQAISGLIFIEYQRIQREEEARKQQTDIPTTAKQEVESNLIKSATPLYIP